MENATIDPLAGLASDIPEGTARDHAAALVLGGAVSIEAANSALAARGAAGLTINSREVAETARAALMNDDAFRAAYLAGNPDAVAKLFKADLHCQQASGGKLTDRPVAPADYSLEVAPHMPSDTPADRVQNYSDDLAKLVSAIELPKPNAQALTDAHFTAIKETAIMTKDEQSLWGQNQTTMLHKALGADAENQIAAATATLAKAGRTLNIADIANSNGAEAALILVHQAQVLARQRK